jgi:hypothetical protein
MLAERGQSEEEFTARFLGGRPRPKSIPGQTRPDRFALQPGAHDHHPGRGRPRPSTTMPPGHPARSPDRITGGNAADITNETVAQQQAQRPPVPECPLRELAGEHMRSRPRCLDGSSSDRSGRQIIGTLPGAGAFKGRHAERGRRRGLGGLAVPGVLRKPVWAAAPAWVPADRGLDARGGARAGGTGRGLPKVGP